MNDGPYTRDMLKRMDPDVTILTLNATKFTSMAKEALPVARQRNTGVLAMKVMRDIVGKKATARELLQYAWTEQGVATAVIGHKGIEPKAGVCQHEVGKRNFLAQAGGGRA